MRHIDGKHYINPWMGRSTKKGILKVLRWKLFGKNAKSWPVWVENTAEPHLPERLEKDEIALTFINHASFLIQTEKANILTDPVYSNRVSPFSWMGPKRVREPGLVFEELPEIDFVLLTHCHYDHMDIPTLVRLEKRFSPTFVAGLESMSLLRKHGLKKVRELDWWETYADENETSFSFTPAQHFSARTPWDFDRRLWGGFVISSGEKKLYFVGDTGYGEIFSDIADRLGPFDLSIIPIGAYEPRWFMKDTHVNPEEAVQLHLDIQSKKSVAMHFGTFQLTDEAMDDPVIGLRKALHSKGIPDENFLVMRDGETRIFTVNGNETK